MEAWIDGTGDGRDGVVNNRKNYVQRVMCLGSVVYQREVAVANNLHANSSWVAACVTPDPPPPIPSHANGRLRGKCTCTCTTKHLTSNTMHLSL